MANALVTMLPIEFTDKAMKTILADEILSKGSLMLLDPSHPVAPWPAGVPSNNDRLQNIADISASRIVTGEIRPSFQWEANMAAGSFIERTKKAGLRVGVSAGQTTLSGANIVMPDPILQYMLNNQSHEFYFSMWSYVTRTAEYTQTDEPHMHIYRSLQLNGYPRGGVVSISAQGNWERPTGDDQTGRFASSTNSVGAQFRNIAGHISGKRNDAGDPLTIVDFAQNKHKALVSLGPANDESLYTAAKSVSPGVGRLLQSWNFYRVYIEDLTVSGRTYDDVSAIDRALYTKEVLNTGGRYANDEWTANP